MLNQDLKIEKFTENDRQELMNMMIEFFSSEAVSTNGNPEIFKSTIDNCIYNPTYVEGYILKFKNENAGYIIIAKSFTTEFGKNCLWLEDLYLKNQFRGKGIIPYCLDLIKAKYPNHIFKLEVEAKNEHAIHVYKKFGFKEFPYFVMHT